MSKGSNPRPYGVDIEKFDDNFDRIFGKKEGKPEAGRWRHDKETGKLIPLDEWFEKYGKAIPQTHFIIGDIDAYISPMTNQWVTSRKAHRDDLKRHGCRVYEGRESEVREANKYKAEQDRKYDKSLNETVEKTYYELRDGVTKPEKKIKSSWLMGED